MSGYILDVYQPKKKKNPDDKKDEYGDEDQSKTRDEYGDKIETDEEDI
jgi:hypothetical protein